MALPSVETIFSGISTQQLPFWITQAKSEHDFELAAKARQVAYSKHLPEFGRLMSTPDHDDRHPDSAVLLAFSKLDRTCIGTLRIQISGQRSIRLEDSFALPSALRSGRIAEISRLAIPASSNGFTLRLMLIKAAYWYCRANEVERGFLCARHPVDRQYRRFDLQEVLPSGEFVPMQHIGMIPHRIFWFDVFKLDERWLASGNPLHSVFFLSSHPDLLEDVQSRTLLQETQGRLRFHG